MTDIVITAAKRTPVGSFLGAFAATPAHELGTVAIEAALEQAGVEAAEDVGEVILGQVLTAAQGQNPARQASMAAGVPKKCPPWASIRSAAPACAPWPSPPRRSRPATRPSSSRAARRACGCRAHAAASARRHQDGRRQRWSTR